MSQPPIRFDDGAAYERLMGIWSRSAGRVFLDFLSPSPGQRWLDVGCGNGAFTDLVAQDCAPGEIHGIDPSEGQLAFARNRLEGRNVTFRQGDALALPFDDGTFDIAVMALVIHYVSEPARAIAEMVRVLRPGGTIATYVWAYDLAATPLDPFDAEFEAVGIPAPAPPSVSAGSLKVLRDLWTDAGLQQIETRTITVERTFADFDELWGSVTGTGRLKTAVAAMDTETTARVQKGLRIRLPADAEGRITYPSSAYAIKGYVPD